MINVERNHSLPKEDLHFIVSSLEDQWCQLTNAKFFITGATGFIGCLLIQSLFHANETMNLNISIAILVRNKASVLKKMPYLKNNPIVTIHEGDIIDFMFPNDKYFTHVIHLAATSASPKLNIESPLIMFNILTKGTMRILDFCKEKKVKNMLYLSSGAVYGTQPKNIEKLSENYQGGPDTMAKTSAYAEGKRSAELLCAIYARTYGIDIKIARGFSFYGPCMPLDEYHAFGSFILDILDRKNIQIFSDGQSIRSYLYVSDLTIWLWKILLEGKSCYPYNVGSEQEITLRELAELISEYSIGAKVEILNSINSKNNTKYIPSIERIKTELGVIETTGLREGIVKTLSYFHTYKGKYQS